MASGKTPRGKRPAPLPQALDLGPGPYVAPAFRVSKAPETRRSRPSTLDVQTPMRVNLGTKATTEDEPPLVAEIPRLHALLRDGGIYRRSSGMAACALFESMLAADAAILRRTGLVTADGLIHGGAQVDDCLQRFRLDVCRTVRALLEDGR